MRRVVDCITSKNREVVLAADSITGYEQLENKATITDLIQRLVKIKFRVNQKRCDSDPRLLP